MLRLRSSLREFFPGALAAFEDLTAPGALLGISPVRRGGGAGMIEPVLVLIWHGDGTVTAARAA